MPWTSVPGDQHYFGRFDRAARWMMRLQCGQRLGGGRESWSRIAWRTADRLGMRSLCCTALSLEEAPPRSVRGYQSATKNPTVQDDRKSVLGGKVGPVSVDM